jgi:hypothetical protein
MPMEKGSAFEDTLAAGRRALDAGDWGAAVATRPWKGTPAGTTMPGWNPHRGLVNAGQ